MNAEEAPQNVGPAAERPCSLDIPLPPFLMKPKLLQATSCPQLGQSREGEPLVMSIVPDKLRLFLNLLPDPLVVSSDHVLPRPVEEQLGRLTRDTYAVRKG